MLASFESQEKESADVDAEEQRKAEEEARSKFCMLWWLSEII